VNCAHDDKISAGMRQSSLIRVRPRWQSSTHSKRASCFFASGPWVLGTGNSPGQKRLSRTARKPTMKSRIRSMLLFCSSTPTSTRLDAGCVPSRTCLARMPSHPIPSHAVPSRPVPERNPTDSIRMMMLMGRRPLPDQVSRNLLYGWVIPSPESRTGWSCIGLFGLEGAFTPG